MRMSHERSDSFKVGLGDVRLGIWAGLSEQKREAPRDKTRDHEMFISERW